MRVLHIGLGDYGYGWCRALSEYGNVKLVGIVDKNDDTFKKVSVPSVPCFTDLQTAISSVKPDFIMNASPPDTHLPLNRIAFLHNIPVLMEKPISEDFSEVQESLELARKGQKIVVAENYRYMIENMFVKEQVDRRLYNLTGINLTFRKHHNENNYHKELRHPMLIDVGIHHLDLLRFFSGKEAVSVYARLNTPEWSWYKGYSNVKMVAEMEDGVLINYDASLDSHYPTEWSGTWTFTAENGVAVYDGNKLQFDVDGNHLTFEIPKESKVNADKYRILDDFLAYINGGIVPPTDISDQYKTAIIAQAAILAHERGSIINISNL